MIKNVNFKDKIQYSLWRVGSNLPLLAVLLFISALGILIPLNLFSDGRIIAGGDQISYYNPAFPFFDHLYTWLDRLNFGEPHYGIPLLFPFHTFFKLLSLSGFSPVASQILWTIYLFTGSGLFMFLLVWDLIPSNVKGRIQGAFIASVFYMVNPYIMTDIFQISQRPVQVAFPLLVFLWNRGLQAEKNQYLYAVLFSLATLLTASTGTAPAFLAIIPPTLFFFTFFWFIFHRGKLLRILIFVLSSTVLSVLVNLWWLVPSMLAYRNTGESIQKTITAGDYTKSTTILESLRLFGFWAFRTTWRNLPHIPYAINYYKMPLVLISYLLTAVGLSGLFFKVRRRSFLSFSFLFLLGVFLSKGANQPFGDYYSFLFNNFPPFSLFREPYSKITTLSLFSLAVLLGLSWSQLISLVKNPPNYQISILMGILLLIYSYPIVTGEVIQNPSWHGIKRDSLHVEVPNGWFELGEWLEKNDPEGRILLFPKSSYGVCYKWKMGTCAGQPVARLFLPNQTIRYTFADELPRDKVISGLYQSLNQGYFSDISSVMKFYGIRYILQQNDLDWQHGLIDTLSPEEAANLLGSSFNGLKKIKTSEVLDLYSYNGAERISRIFATSSLDFVSGDASSLPSLAEITGSGSSRAFYFINKKEDTGSDYLDLDSPTAGSLIVMPKKVNPDSSDGLATAVFPVDGNYNVYLKVPANFNEDDLQEVEFSVGDNLTFKASRDEIDASLKAPARLRDLSIKAGDKIITTKASYSVSYLKNLYSGSLRNINLTPGRYIISFYYSFPAGTGALFSIKEEGRCNFNQGDVDEDGDGDCDQPQMGEDLLVSEGSPKYYRKDFRVSAPGRSISLVFKTNNPNLSNHPVNLDGFRLEKILDNFIYFVRELDEGKKDPPMITFKREKPTLFRIWVKSSTGPYFLSFLETFNRHWKVGISGQYLTEDRHFLLNGFGNGWLIKPEDAGGKSDYQLTLVYEDQKLFYFGSLISLTTVTTLLGYTAFLRIKYDNRRS